MPCLVQWDLMVFMEMPVSWAMADIPLPSRRSRSTVAISALFISPTASYIQGERCFYR